jgi:hypothetical protein
MSSLTFDHGFNGAFGLSWIDFGRCGCAGLFVR